MNDIIDKYTLLETIDRYPNIITEIDILKIYDRLSKDDQIRVNQTLTKIIADAFEGSFAAFLNKRLYQVTRKLELVHILKKIKEGDVDLKDKLFSSISVIIVDYYEKIIKGGLFKSSISGNRHIDRIYARLVEKMFDNPDVMEYFKKNVDGILTDKFKKILNTPEFLDLIEEDIVHKVKSKIGRTFGGREAKLKWTVLDKMLEHLPSINDDIKKMIKKDIFNTNYNDILKMVKRNSMSEISKLFSKHLIEYFYLKTKQKFNGNAHDRALDRFSSVLYYYLNKPESIHYFSTELEDYISYIETKR